MRVAIKRGRMLPWLLVLGLAWLVAAGASRAAGISAPATSTTGTFSVSWPIGYELRLADANWRVGATSATTASFTDLPAGTYRFMLASCQWTSTVELGNRYSCTSLPSSAATVVVTGAEAAAVEAFTAEAGNTPYRAGVSARGSAQINVPLRIPSGVNGVALDLALAYDSARAGDRPRYVVDDVLGYGWSLQGVSYVHRCRAGQTEEPYRGGMPTLSGSDAICLDGEPLTLVGGTHWNAGAEYRAADNPELKVTLRETAGVGRWFEVSYPDGAVGRFGDTADSRAVASGQLNYYSNDVTPSETYLWGIRKLTGAQGDVLTVAYEHFDGYGVLQPGTIAYGGAEVRFSYGVRDDLPALGLGLNARVRRTSVLNGVAVRMNGHPVREYRLQNRADAAGRLRLERIQECGYDAPGSTASCLLPLQLAWTDVPAGAMNDPVAVAELTDGLGARTGYGYAALTATRNPLGYQEAPFGALMAVPDTVATDLAAVVELRVSDGLAPDGFRRWSYGYKGLALRSALGRGFAGFPEMRATDRQSGIVSYSQIRLDWPFVGAASQIRAFDAAYGAHAQELAREEHAYAQKVHANGARHAYRARSTRWLLEGGVTVGGSLAAVSFCYRALSADLCPGTGAENDFPTQRRTVTTEGTALSNPVFTPAYWGDVPSRTIASQQQKRTVTAVAALANTSAPWIRGAVAREAVTHAVPGQTSRTVRQDTTYLPGTRVVLGQTRFPADARLERVATWTFDATAGNAVSAYAIAGAGVPSRAWRYATPYENGRSAAAVTNPLGQTTSRTVDDRFGLPRSVTDADGRTTTVEYDPFGRRIREAAPDGTEVSVVHERCDQADCTAAVGADAALKVTIATRSGSTRTAPTRVVYLDVLGRTVLEEVEALDSAQGWHSRRIGYDIRNRVQYRSRPALGATARACTAAGPDCTWYAYDLRDRVVREDRPDGGVTTTTYAGAIGRTTVSSTETIRLQGQASGNRTTKTSYDVLGLVTETTDAAGSAAAVTTTYTYDAHGNLSTVAIGGTTVATLEHDLAGNRTRMVDASSGTTEFAYNALGELVRSTDARGQATSYDHDALGRLIRRTDAGGIAHAWAWDPPNAVGRLAARSRPGFVETYSYDADHGRLARIDAQVNVTGVWSGSRTRLFEYDAAGRLLTQQYPNGQTVTYGYSASGYPTRVVSEGIVLQERRATDPFGHPTEERYHDDAFRSLRSYDPATGRLTRTQTGTPAAPRSIQDLETVWRSNGTLNRRLDRRNTATTGDDYVDAFSYDAMQRLVRQTTSSGATRVLDFGYDPMGNLDRRSSSVASDLAAGAFVYGGPGQPYRLAGVTIGGIPNTLSHDANGNVVGYVPTAGARTWLRYDARNNVARITLGSDESAFQARDEFWYDPDDRRFLSRESWSDAGSERIRRVLYLGGDYEEILPAAGARWDVVQRIQVTPTVRLLRRRDASSQTWESTHEYVHRDHLRSVDVITDARGAVLGRTSFDPFGSRRASSRAGDLTAAGLEALLADQDVRGARGFTDHEHRDRTGFVHMNGRVYDPRIGRFVSPDPVVQAPRASQAYNRYAYAFNDPMSRSDPSGYCGREEGYQLNVCDESGELMVITGTRAGGGSGFFGTLDPEGGNLLTLGPVGSGGLPVLPGMDSLLADLKARLAGDDRGADAETDLVEVIRVTGKRADREDPDGGLGDWLARGLAGLDDAGIRSLFGSVCLGTILGGCGAIALQTGDGSVYGMLLFGISPGAGISIGTEGVLFASDFQASSGFGTAVMASGGVAGIGASVGLAQGTNGVNATGAVGYGFGFGGGVGFYYSGPIGTVGH